MAHITADLCKYYRTTYVGVGDEKSGDDSELGVSTNPAYAIHQHRRQSTLSYGSSAKEEYDMDNNPVYSILGIPSNTGHPPSDVIPVPEYDYPIVVPPTSINPRPMSHSHTCTAGEKKDRYVYVN